MRSNYPVGTLWLNHQPDAISKPLTGPEDILISRPEFDPVINILPIGAFDFLQALDGETSLESAVEAAPEGFDFPTTLSLCMSQNILCNP